MTGFGAGPMRRGGRRGQAGALGDVARQRLREAHQLLEDGQNAEAADLFARMAGVARDRGMPRMATHLSARGAAAHARAGNAAGFREQARDAISDAKLDGDKDRAARTFGALLAEVRDSPLAEAAPELEAEVRSQLGVVPRAAPEGEGEGTVNRSMRRHLPQQCASCGAPVSGAKIRFNDDGSIDCPYCGSLLTG